jgi:hypothetical protein
MNQWVAVAGYYRLHISFLLWEHLIKLISEAAKSLVRGRDFYWEISLPGDIPLTSLAHLLSLGQVWLTHSSGYSSDCSGPKTEMENTHVEIPISNKLLQSLSPPFLLNQVEWILSETAFETF